MDGAEFYLDQPVITIGRLEDQHVSLPLSMTVSRHHARLILKENEYWLEDMSSSYGTFISPDDNRVIGLVKLKPGMTFRLGPFTILKLITEDVEKVIIEQVEQLMEKLGQHMRSVSAEKLKPLTKSLMSVLNRLDKVFTEDELMDLMQDVIIATGEAVGESTISEQRDVEDLAKSLKQSSQQLAEYPQESVLKSLKTFFESSLSEMIDRVQAEEQQQDEA